MDQACKCLIDLIVGPVLKKTCRPFPLLPPSSLFQIFLQKKMFLECILGVHQSSLIYIYIYITCRIYKCERLVPIGIMSAPAIVPP